MSLGSYSEDDYLSLMHRGWHGGLTDGTPCGSGSRIASTAHVRAALPDLVRKYDVRTVCDAGAGDLHWIGMVEWDVDYRPFDLVPRAPSVQRIDLRKEPLPPCDLILCRYVLGHMCSNDALRTLARFRESAKYLLATQHDLPNQPTVFASYNSWNMKIDPFLLGDPLEELLDHKSTLGLWELNHGA